MRILVTGGAGYLGSVLVELLIYNQHKVTILDNFMYQQTSLNHLTRFCFGAPGFFDVVCGDARDGALVKKLTAKADAIIPLAAIVGAPACARDEMAATSTNVEAIQTLLFHASKQQLILIATSNSGYGIGASNEYCTEASPLNPISSYGQTKVLAERLVMERGNAISFRFATLFGMSPRMRLDLLVNDFVYRAVHDKVVPLFEAHFKRNFLHVFDAAGAFIHGLKRTAMAGEIYNVGLSDANLSKWELCERIQKYTPFAYHHVGNIKDPDQRNYIVSNEKIEKTGFRPLYSLDDGIQELIVGCRMLRRSRYANT